MCFHYSFVFMWEKIKVFGGCSNAEMVRPETHKYVNPNAFSYALLILHTEVYLLCTYSALYQVSMELSSAGSSEMVEQTF